jgi:hypothetical protein
MALGAKLKRMVFRSKAWSDSSKRKAWGDDLVGFSFSVNTILQGFMWYFKKDSKSKQQFFFNI